MARDCETVGNLMLLLVDIAGKATHQSAPFIILHRIDYLCKDHI